MKKILCLFFTLGSFCLFAQQSSSAIKRNRYFYGIGQVENTGQLEKLTEKLRSYPSVKECKFRQKNSGSAELMVLIDEKPMASEHDLQKDFPDVAVLISELGLAYKGYSVVEEHVNN